MEKTNQPNKASQTPNKRNNHRRENHNHNHCALPSYFAIRNLIISSACRAIYDSPSDPAVKDPLLTGRT
jgi:hypothetical protein